MPTLEAGQLFERYRVIRWLGSGVSGESYEAEDAILLRKVTLKLIHPRSTLPDSARRQFFREMQGISMLTHPYLASMLDYGEINGRLYVARRYVSSGSLLGAEGRLWFHPPLSLPDAIHYTHQLAQALQHIHNHGYLHGALTFSNILVLRGPNLENEPGYAPFLLADVGLTNFVRRFGEQPATLLPVTAAPEQISKRVTQASDQFALAVLLYFWLTNRPPYLGTPEEIEYLKLTQTITPPSSLNSKITIEQSGILLRALSAYPEDRYPSVLAFADALLGTLTVEAQHPAFPAIEPVTQPELSTQTDSVPGAESASLEEVHVEPITEPKPFLESRTVSPEEEPVMEISTPIELAPVPDTEHLPELAAAPSPAFATIPQTDPLLFSEPLPALEEEADTQTEPEPPEPAPAPGPLPQAVPDVPQPLPDPNAPEPQPDTPQTAPQPHVSQPVPDPVPLPIADVPTPSPQTLPQAELSAQVEPAGHEEYPTDSQVVEVTIPARLIITSPYTEEPYEFILEAAETTIGRAGASDILLDQDNLTSRHHALLKREGDRYMIYDRRSANGVFVNGQKISAETGHELLDGDHISIGNYELIFRHQTRLMKPAVKKTNTLQTLNTPI